MWESEPEVHGLLQMMHRKEYACDNGANHEQSQRDPPGQPFIRSNIKWVKLT
jgi:hypothetical protein